ncbi:hypothetical protein C3943_02355 [Lysinibacillus sp. B2A1]|nr:hypothetical protein C3943_02355 [Lysinibacillus sp. B2A1]
MSFEDEIEQYIYNIQRMQKSINELNGGDFLDNHKKILFLSLLETLAKGALGDSIKGNGNKFRFFVEEFCNWEDAKRVSLQQLYLFLKEKYTTEEKIKFKKQLAFVKSNLLKYPSSTPVQFCFDPKLEEIKSICPSIAGKLNNFTHVSLLWKLRNSLAHEFRGKDTPSLFNDLPYPHYEMYRLPDLTKTWIISYPIMFFNYLVNNAIENVKTYCQKENINPYNNYDFGFLW